MKLEPLLLEIRDRCLEATGEEPREVLANYAFIPTIHDNLWPAMGEQEWEWRGIPVRCILPTDTTTLIVRT